MKNYKKTRLLYHRVFKLKGIEIKKIDRMKEGVFLSITTAMKMILMFLKHSLSLILSPPHKTHYTKA